MLDSLTLDSEPLLVVEVEDWLDQGVEVLRASPVVDIPCGIGSREEAVKISAHRYGRLVGGHRVKVGVSLVSFRWPATGILCVGWKRATEERAVGA